MPSRVLGVLCSTVTPLGFGESTGAGAELAPGGGPLWHAARSRAMAAKRPRAYRGRCSSMEGLVEVGGKIELAYEASPSRSRGEISRVRAAHSQLSSRTAL